MYEQGSYADPGYGSNHRTGKEYDSGGGYDSQANHVIDKRTYASSDIYRDRERLDPRDRYASAIRTNDQFLTTTDSYPASHHLHPHHLHPSSTGLIPGRVTGRNDNKMLVNVGGVRHEILWTTLEKFPTTRLGRLHECRTEDLILQFCDYYSYEDNEYFFDKNPRIFASVISCYRTGKLHIPDEFCLSELVTELRYWGFDESFLDMCCQQKYRTRKMLYQEMKAEAETELYQLYGYTPGYGYEMFNPFGIGQCAAYRKFLYDSYENPRIGKTTRVLPAISIIFNILGVVCVILNTMDYFKDRDKFGKYTDNLILSRLTMASVSWIAIEFLLRMSSCPQMTRFVSNACNIIDFLGCGVYFYTILLQGSKPPDRLTELWQFFIILRVWQVPYMVCKVIYDPWVLQIDTTILWNFNKQFWILMMFFLTVLVWFSAAIFVSERVDPSSPFTSIPESFWFTIATLTTIGNFPVYPTTVWGKYFASLCSIVGVIFLAAVITVANFARVLQHRSAQLKAQHQQQAYPGIPGMNPQGMMSGGMMSGGMRGMPYSMIVNPAPGSSSNAPGIQHLPPPASSHLHPSSTPLHQQSSSTTGQINVDDRTSFHHITFNDDLLNALGTIDVLVERERKASSRLEPPSYTSNKVKTITMKIKLDSIPRPTQHTGMTATGVMPGVVSGSSKLHSTTTAAHGGTTTTGGLSSFFASSSTAAAGTTSNTGAALV